MKHLAKDLFLTWRCAPLANFLFNFLRFVLFSTPTRLTPSHIVTITLAFLFFCRIDTTSI